MISADHINPFLMAAKKVFQDMCFVELSIQKPKLQEAGCMGYYHWCDRRNAWTGIDRYDK